MSRDWSQLLWREKTWGERAQTCVAFVIALVITMGLCVGGLIVIGGALDGLVQMKTQHDTCLKHATNGYEIRECH